MSKKLKNIKIQRFADVPRIQQRIKTQTLKSGEYFYDYKLQQAQNEQSLMEKDQFHKKFKINFADLPISSLTLKGLAKKNFVKMTEVQRCVIPHALAGRDIMAASRTGSGKTLAYLIPLIQKLYRNKFMPIDGLGAIVLVPVRELAMQVFEVLNSFTNHMEISVGLIIGGKSIKYEQQKIGIMNILICTPGRLLQHLEETYGFETNNLQMLVIDEADVMLDMGFRNTLNSILQSIPRCQTLFFSATLNNEIHKLSQQCMKEPERIFLHTIKHNEITSNKDEKKNVDTIYQTPAKLMQYYMVVKPEDKLNVLYSFLKTHHKQKVIIFTSTCKQVRFIYEAFRKFRLSSPLYELQGHQKQKKRMAIYFTFCEKQYGILVCTNIASRGLDFPMVDWVIQLDVPEDVETYVHRAGRTARFKQEGKSLTFVSEHEQEFVSNLKAKNIKIHKITQNPEKYFKIDSSLQSICSEHQDVKYLAQRALISYIQFVYKSSNKSIFNIKHLNLELVAKSFGLQNAPNLSIQQNDSEDQEGENVEKKMTKIEKMRMKAKLAKQKKRNEKQQANQVQSQSEDQEQLSQEEESEQKKPQKVQKTQKLDNMQKVQNNAKDEDDFLKVTKKVKLDENAKPILAVSKNQLKKIKPQGHFEGKNKIIFDDDLNKMTYDQFRVKKLLQGNEKNTKIQRNFEFEIQNRLQQNRQIDEKDEKERRKIRRKKIDQQKEQARRGYSRAGPQEAVLGDSQDQEPMQDDE